MNDKNRRRAAAVAAAIALAAPAEGLRRVAYSDIANPKLLTVCYGSTTNVQKGKKYTIEECKARLDADMLKAVEAVERCAPGLPVNVLAAFGDAVYNMGESIACDTKKSTAARYLHAGRIIDACNQLPRWDKANVGGVMVELTGLKKRRSAEREICLKGST